MVDIYKELDEEIALAGGIDKLVQSDLAKMKLGNALSEFDRDSKQQIRLVDSMPQRTAVRILGASDIAELEDAINEFLYDRERDPKSGFRLLDIKYSAQNTTSEALIIYSEIDPNVEAT